MPQTGYSGTPLIKKLGITPAMKLCLYNAPADYFDLLGADIRTQVVKSGTADLAHLFVTSREELKNQFNAIIKQLPAPGAIIWVSWHKKASKIPTDVTEDGIREIVLPTGWVDVKVCAVSDQWSGLKIVRRKENR